MCMDLNESYSFKVLLHSLLCAFTVSTKDAVSLPKVLSAKQLYCPASASSALHSSRMDHTNVTPFSVTRSS